MLGGGTYHSYRFRPLRSDLPPPVPVGLATPDKVLGAGYAGFYAIAEFWLEFEEFGMGVEEGFRVVVLGIFVDGIAVALLDDLAKMHNR